MTNIIVSPSKYANFRVDTSLISSSLFNIMVKRKVNGAKNKNSNMGPQPRRYVGNAQWNIEGYSRGEPARLSREIRRKSSPPKVRNGAQGACSVMELEGFKELKGLTFQV
nr:hypothetical protein CFP56_15903 [Quercus suber]